MNDSTASDSIYSHKDSFTISNNQPLRYVEAPEFIEPVADPIVMNTPRYSPPINPDYLKLAQITYDMILQTMMEGEKKHGADEWKKLSIYEHGIHAAQHIMDHSMGYTAEDHIAHAMTRCAMIKMLEDEQYGIKSKA